jgi:hypothetical protein
MDSGMRVIVLIFALLFPYIAMAQVPMTGAGLGTPAVVAGYTGPGDLSLTGTLVKYWGFSCVTNAYTGNVADIVDGATGNTTGSRLQCASGTLVALVSGSACTFVTGNACSTVATTCAVSCVVVTLYEQFGTATCTGSTVCNITQATNASRPTYSASGGAGGRACASFTSTQSLVTSAAGPTYAQPFSIATLDERTSGTALSGVFSTNGSFAGVYHNAANQAEIYAGSAGTATASDNAFHAMQTVFNGASSILAVDGSGTTVNPNTGSFASGTFGMGDVAAAFTGVICEAMVFTGANSSANNTTLNSNQHTRFGF